MSLAVLPIEGFGLKQCAFRDVIALRYGCMNQCFSVSHTLSTTNSCGVPIHKVQAFTWLSQHPHGAQTSLTSLTICCFNFRLLLLRTEWREGNILVPRPECT